MEVRFATVVVKLPYATSVPGEQACGDAFGKVVAALDFKGYTAHVRGVDETEVEELADGSAVNDVGEP